eukprot:scaffold104427_cov76-Phaeocystis_antarctica.AAC.1
MLTLLSVRTAHRSEAAVGAGRAECEAGCVVERHLQCTPRSAHAVHTQCTRSAHAVHTQCTRSAHAVHTQRASKHVRKVCVAGSNDSPCSASHPSETMHRVEAAAECRRKLSLRPVHVHAHTDADADADADEHARAHAHMRVRVVLASSAHAPCICGGATCFDAPMQASGAVPAMRLHAHACAAAQFSGLPLAKGAQTPTPTTVWLARTADCTGATCRAEAIAVCCDREIEQAREANPQPQPKPKPKPEPNLKRGDRGGTGGPEERWCARAQGVRVARLHGCRAAARAPPFGVGYVSPAASSLAAAPPPPPRQTVGQAGRSPQTSHQQSQRCQLDQSGLAPRWMGLAPYRAGAARRDGGPRRIAKGRAGSGGARCCCLARLVSASSRRKSRRGRCLCPSLTLGSGRHGRSSRAWSATQSHPEPAEAAAGEAGYTLQPAARPLRPSSPRWPLSSRQNRSARGSGASLSALSRRARCGVRCAWGWGSRLRVRANLRGCVAGGAARPRRRPGWQVAAQIAEVQRHTPLRRPPWKLAATATATAAAAVVCVVAAAIGSFATAPAAAADAVGPAATAAAAAAAAAAARGGGAQR